MAQDDLFSPADLTTAELNAIALADAQLDMLTELVELRRAKGLTQEDVAAAIGRNKSAVSRFERLDSDPRLSTVRRYARAIGALIEHQVSDFESKPEAAARVDEWGPRVEIAWAVENLIAPPIGLTAAPLPGLSPNLSTITSMFGAAAGTEAARHYSEFVPDETLIGS